MNIDNSEYLTAFQEPTIEGSIVICNRMNSLEPVIHRHSISNQPNIKKPAAQERKLLKANPCISPPEVAEFISVHDIEKTSPIPNGRQQGSSNILNEYTLEKQYLEETEAQAISISCWQKYTNFAECIRNSWLLIPVLLVLLCGSIGVLYIGTVHREKCRFFPTINQFQGGLGIATIISQLICMPSSCRSRKRFWTFCKTIECSSLYSFLIVHVIEVCIFAVINFSDSPNKRYYCEPYFYNFTKTYIGLQFLVLVLTAVINLPICYGSIKSCFDLASKIVIEY